MTRKQVSRRCDHNQASGLSNRRGHRPTQSVVAQIECEKRGKTFDSCREHSTHCIVTHEKRLQRKWQRCVIRNKPRKAVRVKQKFR